MGDKQHVICDSCESVALANKTAAMSGESGYSTQQKTGRKIQGLSTAAAWVGHAGHVTC